MFAVLKTGGKQYRVAPNDVITVEKLAAEAGETVQFNEILMLGGGDLTVGAPFVSGAAVQAEVLDQLRGPKLINFKRRRRKHSSARKKGHRQYLTSVRITEILAEGADSSGVKAAIGAGSAPAAAAPAEKPAPKAKKAAAPKPAAPKPAEAEATEAKAPKAKAAEDAAPSGTRPDNLLTEAQGTADDLKRISGVGLKLEGLLNGNGVFHFWQIAAWGSEEVAFMDDLLSFKGRIERDDWIAQAKAFVAEADGADE
ncbi:MAG: 50S ribosomal protein L21 [Pseudomonadota bacterium]